MTSMSKVSVSLPAETEAGIKALVEAGAAASFSAYIADAATASLQRDQALTVLRGHTGGPRGGQLRERAACLFGDTPNPASLNSPSGPNGPAAGDLEDAGGAGAVTRARKAS